MLRAGASGQLNVDIARKFYRSVAGEGRAALADVTLDLAPGALGAIVGPSGCGKTSLLRIVAGLDQNFEGAVTLPDPARIAFVFQEPRLLPWRTVEANIRIAAPQASAQDIAGLFDTLGLAAHRTHYPGELSLGLARRAAIARALALTPDLLLLDEPFASLDAATADRLAQELMALLEKRRVTTLLVTHDIAIAVSLADVVFALSSSPGRLIARLSIDTPRRLRTRDELRALAAQLGAAV